MRVRHLVLILVVLLSLSGCFVSRQEHTSDDTSSLTPKTMTTLRLTSTAWENNMSIPKQFTCEGRDINPPLSIIGVPDGVKSFVLIVDDPDAPIGIWDHWVLWNIPGDTRFIAENTVPKGAVEGINDFKKTAYGGPCPPPGRAHRYFFKLYALDAKLDLARGSTKEDVEQAMLNHIVDETELVGVYQR